MKNYVNWKLFFSGLGCIAVGYAVLSVPPATGFLSLTAAPLLLVCGYVVLVPLSLLPGKSTAQPDDVV